MKIGKAPQLLKKAATIFRSKASIVRERLLIIASLRRRMAMIGTISHRIHALMVEKEKARVDYNNKNSHDGKALVLRKAKAGCEKTVSVHEEMMMITDHHLSELELFDHEYHNWAHSLFNDDTCYNDEYNCGDDFHGAFDDDDEPSVIDIIRSNREDEGLEFNIDDEIDQAADMFIRRFRNRMSQSN
uniref:Uncharacterized protein n=1 Tax=Leersia perrieri TaxID=77586 RepID=A0A0D9XFJ0_9ORYZ